MPRVSYTLTFRDPPERVWLCLSDAEIASSLAPEVRVEFIPPGPAHAGQIIRKTVATPGGEMRVDATCTHAEPPWSHTMEWSDLLQGKVPLRWTQRTVLRSVPDGTSVMQELVIRAPNAIAWFIAWLGKPQFARMLAASLERTRAVVEARDREGGGAGA